jgi:prepilin signal peptidase PulO-like enzyme (type II secretory pathway)
MSGFKWGIILYFVFIYSYWLNNLITELPLDDRYKKLRKHFTWPRFFSQFYYPFIYWYRPAFIALPMRLKLRHIFVFMLSASVCIMFLLGFTLLSPVVHFMVYSILTICLFTDLEYQIIPNETSFGLIFIGIIHSFHQNMLLNSFQGIGLAMVVFIVFSSVMLLFGQSHAFGAGDIKLCLGIGAVWGWQVTAIALYFTFLIGGIVGFYFLVIKKESKESYYAFAPVIILGLIFALFYTDSIFDYYYPWVNNSFQIQAVTP